MKKFLAAAIMSVATLAAADSAQAGPMQVMDPGFQNQKLVYSPDQGEKFEPICYGCTSSVTGLPRTEFVSPHIRSNGTYVDGYYRSRRY